MRPTKVNPPAPPARLRQVAIGGDNDPRTYLPNLLEDETLYSFFARCRHHRSLTSTATNWLLRDTEAPLKSQLPNRLNVLAARIAKPDVTGEYIAWRHTLFPYFMAFRTPDVRRKVMSVMLGSGETAIEKTGGVTRSILVPPKSLRFCTACQRSMIERHGEPYWRRTHQLSISMMCPDHGLPLRSSTVLQADARGQYHHASTENCPSDAPSVLDGLTVSNPELFLDLAIKADRLLQDGDIARDRSMVLKDLVATLERKGYANSAGQIQWWELHDVISSALADLIRIHPQLMTTRRRTTPYWLPKVRHGSMRPVPENVLLIERVADAAPDRRPPFGDGPWQCRNPVSDHFGQPVVDQVLIRRRRQKSGYVGEFECSCGYVYFRSADADGKLGPPTFRRFGPLLRPVIARAIEEKWSMRKTANALGTQIAVMLNAMDVEGIPIHWTNLPALYRAASAKKKASLNQQDG